MSKDENTRHVNLSADKGVSHLNLKSRIGSAFVAGCLALSVCPAVALAAQPGQDGSQPENMGSNPPTMQQFDARNFNAPQNNGIPNSQPQEQTPEMPEGQAPDMPEGRVPELPSGQMPDMQQGQNPDNGQQGQAPNAPWGQAPDMQIDPSKSQPRYDGFDDQIRQILDTAYGVVSSLPDNGNGEFQPGNPADAPELPEGAVNVQQVIDSVRDILRHYDAADLESKIGDAEFAETLQDYAKTSTEQRLAMFADDHRGNMENPSDLPMGDVAANETAGNVDMGKTAEQSIAPIGESLMNQIVSLVMDAFGYSAV